MGFSVRSDGWRYTIWVAWNGEMLKPVWEAVQGVELYQHSTLSTDFDGDYSEPHNRAVDPDSEAQAVMKSLHAVLVGHFSNDGAREEESASDGDRGGPGAAARQVAFYQQQLEQCAAELDDGTDLLEQISLRLSNLFLNYSVWDTKHRSQLAPLYAAWRAQGKASKVTAGDEAQAKALSGIELRESAAALQRALVTCRSNRRKRPTVDSSCGQGAVDRSAGFFARDGSTPGSQRFFFPAGYNFAPWHEFGEQGCELLGIELQDLSIGIHMLDPQTLTVPNATVENLLLHMSKLAAAKARVSIFLIHAAMPPWVEAKFPGINPPPDQCGHFVKYDIDHPAVRTLWSALFASLLPHIAGHPAVYSYLLANEPEFPQFSGEHAYAKLHSWLAAKYNGSCAELNAAWGSDYSSIDSVWNVSLPRSPWATWRPASVSTRQWVDIDKFNKQRVTSFFQFLHDQIHDQAKSATGLGSLSTQIKVSNEGHPWGALPAAGINRLALMQLAELNGCDTRMTPSSDSHIPFPQHPQNLYAMDWAPGLAAYDFQRSVGGISKALIDSEWHSLSTVHFRTDKAPVSWRFLGTALWLARLHGQSALEIWYWGRGAADSHVSCGDGPCQPNAPISGDDDGKPGAWFPFSLSSQPAQFDSFLRAHAESNSVADTIVRVANAERRLWILHSPSSALLDREASGWELAAYETAFHLGVQIGWLPAPLIGARNETGVLLIPCTSHIDDASFASLRAATTGTAPHLRPVIVGNASCAATSLRRNEFGEQRPAKEMGWVATVPLADIGNLVTEDAVSAMEAAAAIRSVDRVVTCRGAGGSRVGLFCRATPLTRGESGNHTHALFITNLLNASTTVTLDADGLSRSASSLVFDAAVDLGQGKIELEPLQMMALAVTVQANP